MYVWLHKMNGWPWTDQGARAGATLTDQFSVLALGGRSQLGDDVYISDKANVHIPVRAIMGRSLCINM